MEKKNNSKIDNIKDNVNGKKIRIFLHKEV